MKNKITILFSIIMLDTAQVVFAAEGHTVFNPTPDSELRPMATERSSKTDSTTSLDAGRVQIETSVFAMNYNDDCSGGSCTKTRQNSFGGGN